MIQLQQLKNNIVMNQIFPIINAIQISYSEPSSFGTVYYGYSTQYIIIQLC